MNPEYRQRLNYISRNLESAGEVAQENIYTFTQLYIDPCLEGFKLCLHDCTSPCFPTRDERLRRKRGRSRGRAEANFDFYDDWDDEGDIGSGLVGWGNDELDGLLAGNRTVNKQPGRQRRMSYGSRGRNQTTIPREHEQDPTVVPSSSMFGFLERLPFKVGARGLRYKPSAADLQENPGGVRIRDVESDPLMEEDEESLTRMKRPGRQRSGTAESRSTQTSHSSRGDLIPSDEEEDAVALDDEFAVMLSRRITNSGEEHNSGKSSRRPAISRTSTRTVSSKSTKSGGKKSRRSSSKKSVEPLSPAAVQEAEPPSILELNREEDKIRFEEELEVEQKRAAAKKAAAEQGLVAADQKEDAQPALIPTLVTDITGADDNAVHKPEEERAARRSPYTPQRSISDSSIQPFPDLPANGGHEPQSPEPP